MLEEVGNRGWQQIMKKSEVWKTFHTVLIDKRMVAESTGEDITKGKRAQWKKIVEERYIPNLRDDQGSEFSTGGKNWKAKKVERKSVECVVLGSKKGNI